MKITIKHHTKIMIGSDLRYYAWYWDGYNDFPGHRGMGIWRTLGEFTSKSEALAACRVHVREYNRGQ